MAYRPEDGAGVAGVDLPESVALVTGSTDGIGRETALALGRLGASVVVHGRDREKGEAVLARLREAGAADAELVTADFTDPDAVRTLAGRVRERYDRLDVLVNNAGAWFGEYRPVWGGVEATFAVNHLAPFLLTELLRDRIEATGGRVVTVSSGLESRGSLDLDAVEDPAGYDGMDAYARSKLANVLFTVDLADRLEGATANCLNPGPIPGTAVARNASLFGRVAFRAVALLGSLRRGWLTDRVAHGATTPVYLAASPAVEDVTGEYFEDCAPARPSPAARDPDNARRLREYSAEVAGIDPGDPANGSGP